MSARVFAFLLSLLLLGIAAVPASAEALPGFIAAIPGQIDARREAIRSSADETSVTGTRYYVSAEGDDGNDGRSPETPWSTVRRVNEAELQAGDGVFFRRGDTWRGDMIRSYQ